MKRKGVFLTLLLIVLVPLVISGYAELKNGVAESRVKKKATRPEWKIGDYWEYRHKISTMKEYILLSHRVIRIEEFEGTMCYVLVDKEIPHLEDYLTLDLNKKAFVVGGEFVHKYEPDSGYFNWPLWAGKKWRWPYIRIWKSGGKRTITTFMKVVRIERVRVPAGKFLAFKIVQRVKFKSRFHTARVLWYSPEVKNFVKYRLDFGKGVTIGELVKYEVK